MLRAVCGLAGNLTYIDEVETAARASGLTAAVGGRDTAAIFDWLLVRLNYQGISDSAAERYFREHPLPSLGQISRDLANKAACIKLTSHWHFEDCGYRKAAATCNQPALAARCPLPSYRMRNGRLNQTAVSLALFVRDIAAGDLVAWLDKTLSPTLGVGEACAALTSPFKTVFGVSDKLANMALADLLIGAGADKPHWRRTGFAMIAVDTLVHNFLHRTGVIAQIGQPHLYGPRCYGPDGCAEAIAVAAAAIDGRTFNCAFPKYFARFVQHAIWRYCAAGEFDICNGNRINDRLACASIYCRLRCKCARRPLKKSSK
jgi:hypothetical protein